MPIGLGAGLAISAAVGGGTAVVGAEMNRRASNKAGTVQQQANDAALDFEKAQDERKNKQYEEERAHDWATEELNRQIAAEQFQWKVDDRARQVAQSTPFVNLGSQSAGTLQGLLTVGGNGGNWQVTPGAPGRSIVPPASPLPAQAPRAPFTGGTLADTLRGRFA